MRFEKGQLYVLAPGSGSQYPAGTLMRFTHFSQSQPRYCFNAVNPLPGKRAEICLVPNRAHLARPHVQGSVGVNVVVRGSHELKALADRGYRFVIRVERDRRYGNDGDSNVRREVDRILGR